MANKSTFSFGSFNKEFTFDLPEGLWAKENFVKKEDIEEKYRGKVIPVIAFGVVDVHSDDAFSDECGWIATEEEIIAVPEFQIPEIKAMLNQPEAVKYTKAGHMGAHLEEYPSKYGPRLKFVWEDR